MPLTPGTRLGPYEILAPLGAGGMGEVYRAKDTRLDRSVAVKVLPSHLTQDTERRARLEREAKAVSSLNHPHICTLHDVGHEQGTDYLVMELVEGETLAERLKKGALALDQTLRTAIEIADALDKAHRQGVIHRDLKPGNVMLTKSGSKLMDFGLAKRALGGEGVGNVSALQTASRPLTDQGTLLGTIAYMAPEQLEGKEADARSDLWAFGCVLYEMATGRRAFEGKSQASLISAIMDKEPQPISQLQPLTPPSLERLVKVSLAKDPDDRLQTAHDVMQELKWIAEAPAGSQALTGGGLVPVVAIRRRRRAVGFALLVGIVLGGLAGRWISIGRSSSAPPQAPVRATIPLHTVQVDAGGQIPSFALSPNGQLVALRQDQLLSVRPLSSFSAGLLEGTEGGRLPAFSPDGSALAFVSDNRIKRVAASGGPVVDVAVVASVGAGLAWGEDDWLYFSTGLGTGGIWRVPAVGGEAQAVTRVEDALGDNAHTFPQLLPGKKAVLFTALGPSGGSEDARVVAQVRESGERRTLVEHAMFGRFLPTGHLLYATNAGTVFALPFDPVQIKATGEAVPVLSDVGTGTWGGAAFFAVSDSGTLVFLKRSQRPEFVFRVVDSNGKDVISPFPFDSTTMARVGLAQSPALSPDGQRIALTARGPGSTDIWVLDSRSKEAERLTFDPAEDEFPVWSPDGRSVAYTSAQTGTTRRLFVKSVGSGAQPQLLRTWPRHLHVSSWSRDGRWLAAYEFTSRNETDIWLIPVDGKDPIAVANSKASEAAAQFAPDGKWIAYQSNQSGRPEVYVVSFPGLQAQRQVSTEGGTAPQWDPQGRTLYYLQGDSLVAHDVRAGAEFGKGPSRRLFATQALNFQVTSGGRFILSEPNPQPPDAPLHLVVNWFPELTAKFKK